MNYQEVRNMGDAFGTFQDTMNVAKTALDIAIGALKVSFLAGNFGAAAQIAYLNNIQNKIVTLSETSGDLKAKLYQAVEERQQQDQDVASSNTDAR
jgi:hypothetical protein